MIENRMQQLIIAKFGGDPDTVNLKAVARNVGMRYTTFLDWWHGRTKRYDEATLVSLCAYLKCDVGQLLKYKKSE
jgi:DNA-binding Xre family transcriptional regulator